MEIATEEVRRTFAVKFREARAAAELTQRDVHERTGVDIATISRLESSTWNASMDTLAKLALAVGVPLGDLLPLRAPSED